MNVVLFVNWTAKRFAYPEDENAMWDGQPFSIEPGEKKWLEDFKAQKFSVDLAQRELNRESKPLNKDLIDSYSARCFAEKIELGQSVSPAEGIAAQIAGTPETVESLKCDFPGCEFQARALVGLNSHKRAHAPKEGQEPASQAGSVESEFEGLNE